MELLGGKCLGVLVRGSEVGGAGRFSGSRWATCCWLLAAGRVVVVQRLAERRGSIIGRLRVKPGVTKRVKPGVTKRVKAGVMAG
jgi:hypothetical protein